MKRRWGKAENTTSASLLLPTWFPPPPYLDWWQHKQQIFTSCFIISLRCCHLLWWGLCCCHENKEKRTHPCAEARLLMNSSVFVTVTSVLVCLQERKKNHLFSQKSGLRVWNPKPLPCCFASGRLSRSVRNKLSSIASCGQHKTDAVLAWSKLAIKISSALFAACGRKQNCAKMWRFTA